MGQAGNTVKAVAVAGYVAAAAGSPLCRGCAASAAAANGRLLQCSRGGLGERTAVNVDPACSQQLSSTAKVARRPTGELRKKELMPHSTTTS